VPVYRLYDSGHNDHYYTASSSQEQFAEQSGYQLEGISWYGCTAASGTLPVYTLYSAATGTHALTDDVTTVNQATSEGWANQGATFYACNAQGAEPIYQSHTQTATTAVFLYTADAAEYQASLQNGMTGDGVVFYGLNTP
jgi:hypothetical protein